MKIKKKQTRKQLLKQEDEFISTSTKTILWIKDNYNTVIISLIVIVIVMIGVFSFQYRTKTNLIKSNNLLNLAKENYYTPIRPPQEKQDPTSQPQGFATSEEKYKKTLQLFQELIQLYPDSKAAEEAKFFIPNCLYFLEKYDEALAGFEEYMKLYPTGIFAQQAQVGIGYVYSAKGDYDKSINMFQQILDNNPEFVLRDALYMQIGQSFEKTGSIEKAREAYQSIIINFPDSPFVKDAQEKLNMLEEKT